MTTNQRARIALGLACVLLCAFALASAAFGDLHVARTSARGALVVIVAFAILVAPRVRS